jgi:hypothetical protein
MASNAVDRAMEMMQAKMKDIPPLAFQFAKYLSVEFGFCGETLVTAYAVYAQAVEGLTCADDLYRARPQDLEWFARRMAPDTPNLVEVEKPI